MAAMLTVKQAQQHLRSLGWNNVSADGKMGPITSTGLRNFQRGFAFWNLSINGKLDQKTSDALRHAVAKGGRCSANFRFLEFRCKGGVESGCQRIWVKRELVRALEKYRMVVGSFTPISGCRCKTHNRRVGGASSSQHLYGAACDIPQEVSKAKMKSLRLFSGIGYQGSTGKIRHVDLRHLSGHNTTGASVGSPTMWRYA